MLDAATASVLSNALRRESLSVLQYAGEAYPWSSAGEREGVMEVRRLWQEDRDRIGELTRFLYKKRIRPPFIGAFPTSFTTLNFIGLRFLLTKLVEDQKRAVADVERDVAAVTDPETHEVLQKVLDVKKKHLPVLEQLASRTTQPAA